MGDNSFPRLRDPRSHYVNLSAVSAVELKINGITIPGDDSTVVEVGVVDPNNLDITGDESVFPCGLIFVEYNGAFSIRGNNEGTTGIWSITPGTVAIPCNLPFGANVLLTFGTISTG